jgi:hypothetical protein
MGEGGSASKPGAVTVPFVGGTDWFRATGSAWHPDPLRLYTSILGWHRLAHPEWFVGGTDWERKRWVVPMGEGGTHGGGWEC